MLTVAPSETQTVQPKLLSNLLVRPWYGKLVRHILFFGTYRNVPVLLVRTRIPQLSFSIYPPWVRVHLSLLQSWIVLLLFYSISVTVTDLDLELNLRVPFPFFRFWSAIVLHNFRHINVLCIISLSGTSLSSISPGSHKERFGEDGKGKGMEGRADLVENSGYVGNYKGADTYDKTH